MEYIYKYLEKSGKVIYVGITNSLEKRHREHKRDEWYKRNLKLFYYPLETRNDAEMLEAHFIALYKPKFNKAKTGWGKSSFVKNDLQWKEYNEKKFSKELPDDFYSSEEGDYYAYKELKQDIYAWFTNYQIIDISYLASDMVKIIDIYAFYQLYLEDCANEIAESEEFEEGFSYVEYYIDEHLPTYMTFEEIVCECWRFKNCVYKNEQNETILWGCILHPYKRKE